MLLKLNLRKSQVSLQDYLKPALLATIGDETAKTTKEIFGKVDIIAEPFTEEGLIASIEKYCVERELLINA